MKKRILSLALALVLALGVAAPAFAASPTFTDVPEGHWAFQSVEEAAAKGLMNGTGNGQFSPNMKVSVAQFLTLVGRVVFPDVKAEGTDWYGPYVSKAQETGLLAGTQVDTGNVQAEITRYDMAVILRAAAKKLGVAEKLAETSEITDYGMIPPMYAEAVRAVYGLGLIKGDEKGNFNGANTMMRSEVVTVVVRLANLEQQEPEQETVNFDTTYKIISRLVCDTKGNPSVQNVITGLPSTPYKVYYTTDGGATSTLVAEGVSDDGTGKHYAGRIECEFKVPRSWLRAENAMFYISAEGEQNGRKMVTRDLRTDGRAAIDSTGPINLDTMLSLPLYTQMTPPDGEKVEFELNGKVNADVWERNLGYFNPSGITVQLYHMNGNLLGETISDENGEFVMQCIVDALDYSYTKPLYYIQAQGYVEGVLCTGGYGHDRDGQRCSLEEMRIDDQSWPITVLISDVN